MKEGNIYIYGDIFNEQSSFASDWGIVSLSNVVKQFDSVKDSDEIFIHIHSRGGDVHEGFAIHDYLVNTGKKLITIVEGYCASIATIVFLAGSVRKMTENSEFMIHNPWGMAVGDSDELQKYVDELKRLEDKIVDFYVEKTGTDKNQIKDLVDKESILTAEEAEHLNFATEIIETIKAVAYFNPNQNNKEMKELIERLSKGFNNLSKVLLGEEPPVNLILESADGTKLDIETQEKIPQIGNAVKVDGIIAGDKEYIMPKGETIVVKEGKISEIREPVKKEEADVNALSEKVSQLSDSIALQQKSIETLQASYNDATTALGALTDKLDGLFKGISSNYVPPARVIDKTGPAGSVKDPVTEALERRKARKAELEAQKVK